MSDRERQEAVEAARRGCLVVVLICGAAVLALVALRGPLPTLGGALIALGIGLALIDWAARW